MAVFLVWRGRARRSTPARPRFFNMKQKPPKTVTLAGKRWTIRLSSSARAHYGWCDHSKREIVLSTRQTPEEMADTLIHECLHAILPYCDECFVQAAASELTAALETMDII